MGIIEEIREELLNTTECKYQKFQGNLIPTIDPSTIIGVRTPYLRDMAKRINKRDDRDIFLNDLPHRYFEENQLHCFIISLEKDFDKCISEVERFLPYVDNWATCDQMSPKVFKKQPEKLLPFIDEWIATDHTYKIRFGVGMLMEHFLDDRFDVAYPEKVSKLRSEEYYVNMMIAWYFATALAKQYEATLPFIEKQALDVWTHNKAIQKAIESYRITPEQKEYLRTLKIKTNKKK